MSVAPPAKGDGDAELTPESADLCRTSSGALPNNDTTAALSVSDMLLYEGTGLTKKQGGEKYYRELAADQERWRAFLGNVVPAMDAKRAMKVASLLPKGDTKESDFFDHLDPTVVDVLRGDGAAVDADVSVAHCLVLINPRDIAWKNKFPKATHDIHIGSKEVTERKDKDKVTGGDFRYTGETAPKPGPRPFHIGNIVLVKAGGRRPGLKVTNDAGTFFKVVVSEPQKEREVEGPERPNRLRLDFSFKKNDEEPQYWAGETSTLYIAFKDGGSKNNFIDRMEALNESTRGKGWRGGDLIQLGRNKKSSQQLLHKPVRFVGGGRKKKTAHKKRRNTKRRTKKRRTKKRRTKKRRNTKRRASKRL
jgi:hypothetical protein